MYETNKDNVIDIEKQINGLRPTRIWRGFKEPICERVVMEWWWLGFVGGGGGGVATPLERG